MKIYKQKLREGGKSLARKEKLEDAVTMILRSILHKSSGFSFFWS